MTTFIVPPLEEQPWPSLGGQVCDFIETYLVHGPGDLRGQPARLDSEKRALVYRCYEVYPREHPQAGRRRFRRVGISIRKGSAKTEWAAWIAAVELHPDGPVRCDGFDATGEPVGRPVTDPYIPMVAYTEEQSDDLAYSALYTVISEGPLANDFDIGLERIMRIKGDGKALALAAAPDARDGARTTFEHFDETHRFTTARLKAAHRTMLANLPKRWRAQPWALETTTAYTPGEGSVAEATMAYAKSVKEGERDDSRLFFFHRQASDAHDLATVEGQRAAVLEASGPDIAAWSDIEGIVEQWQDPEADRAYLERVWTNRAVQAALQAFDVNQWHELADAKHAIPLGALVTLGFDGSLFNDGTALVVTEVRTGHQQLAGLWEPPVSPASGRSDPDWEVPKAEVDGTVEECFNRWKVWRLYADPPNWETTIAQWQGRWGEKRVIAWWTNRIKQIAYAVLSFQTAIASGELSHDGNPNYARHIGNACRRYTNFTDERGQKLYVLHKENPHSPNKMDAAMAGVLSWEARTDAIADGQLNKKQGVSVYIPGEEPVPA